MSRSKISITRQPQPGSLEDQVLTTMKEHYGGKFNEKAMLAIVDVFMPLHVACSGGDERSVQDAIAKSNDELRGWHREALNQIDFKPGSSSTRSEKEPSPQPPPNAAKEPDLWPEVEEPEMEF